MNDIKFHIFPQQVKGPLPQRFTFPFAYTPHQLCKLAANEVQAYVALQKQWQHELALGKMLGVLVVKSPTSQLGYLAAFSGQLAGTANHHFFVPAVFDYLQPDGYFKIHENEISALNRQIAAIEASAERKIAIGKLNDEKRKADAEIADYQLFMKAEKDKRTALRSNGNLSAEQESALVRESQFQKAELKRLKARLATGVLAAQAAVDGFAQQIASLKQRREQMSVDLQNWLFRQFVFLNARGEKADLIQIFETSTQPLPPSGAGECCAPKLLQYAYTNGYKPVCMAEFWWGESPKQEVRNHGSYYPACKGKCEPILRFMLQGLSVDESPVLTRAVANSRVEVLFEDDWLLVVNKPSGMLSVPGKIGADSMITHLLRQRPDLNGCQLMPVHRLDMDTSGLLVVAKSLSAFKALQALFETRQVHKRYTALLSGQVPYPTQPIIHEFADVPHPVGRIGLPLCPDVTDRPRQMVSFEHGKESVTFYEILGYEEGCTRVSFFPQTGRTHQLRVHSAHADGLGAPIVGDDLYGTSAQRLCLHAAQIIFQHPFTHQLVNLAEEADF
ncbi:MAG: pseudouridine synthase [Paludibacteraceae bacterium]|nr:pseudouridine synthase [Paludibacteraceae bacterium]